MSTITSQATMEAPQVLCLGDDSLLMRLIKKLFQQQGFEVVYFPINAQIKQNLQNTVNQQYYKTIVVYGFQEQDPIFFQHVVDHFTRHQHQLITLLPWPRNIQALNNNIKEIYKEWIDKSTKISDIYQYSLQINALKIYALDLLNTKKVEYPVKFFLLALKQNLILDPQTKLYLQSEEKLFKEISSLLLRPHETKDYYFLGKEHNSMSVLIKLSDFYQKYYQKDLARRQMDAKNHIVEPLSGIKVVLPTNLNECLDQQARMIGQLTKELKDRVVIGYDEDLNTSVIEEVEKKNKGKINSDSLLEKKTVEGDPSLKQTLFQITKTKPITKEQQNLLHLKNSQNPINKEDELNQQLNSLFGGERVVQKIQKTVYKAKESKKIKTKSKKKTRLFYLGLLFSSIGGTFLLIVVVFLLNLSLFKTKLMNQLNEVFKNSTPVWQSSRHLSLLKTSLNKQLMFYVGKVDMEIFSQAKLLINIDESLEKLYQNNLELNNKATLIYQQSIQNQTESLDEKLINSLSLKTQENFELLSKLQIYIKQLDQAKFNSEQQKTISEFVKLLNAWQKNTSKALQLQQNLAQILGIQTTKTYALVLQDDRELRPSGGFIQAVALLYFKNGQLIDTQTQGVYKIDQQVPGQIELPDHMKPYINEDNWFFHDSNWEVDFPASANKMAWFLRQTNNRSIDGVITLSYSQLASALDVLGDIYLPGHDLSLSKKNFFNRLENINENQTSSINGKYFAEELLEEFVKQAQTISADKTTELLALIGENLENNQQLFVVFEPSLQQVLEDLAWTGSIILPQCPSVFLANDCLVDSLYVSETNIGLNKINHHIQRVDNHQIYISRENIEHQYLLKIENTAFTNNYPLGAYKANLRIYIPQKYVFDEILLNGINIKSAGAKELIFNKHRLAELTIDVPIQQNVELSIKYSQKIKFAEDFSYVFFKQKQTNISPTPLTTAIYYHPTLKPMLIAPQAEVINGGIVFNSHHPKHDFFAVKFE